MKELVGTFNKEIAIVGAFFGHGEISRSPVESSRTYGASQMMGLQGAFYKSIIPVADCDQKGHNRRR